MCQLLGMNANTPTDVMFSFTGLAVRADEHKDGFGIAFFEGAGNVTESIAGLTVLAELGGAEGEAGAVGKGERMLRRAIGGQWIGRRNNGLRRRALLLLLGLVLRRRLGEGAAADKHKRKRCGGEELAIDRAHVFSLE